MVCVCIRADKYDTRSQLIRFIRLFLLATPSTAVILIDLICNFGVTDCNVIIQEMTSRSLIMTSQSNSEKAKLASPISAQNVSKRDILTYNRRIFMIFTAGERVESWLYVALVRNI